MISPVPGNGMGTKEPESKDQKFSVMVSGNGSGGTSSDPNKNEAATPTQGTPAKELSSSLSSSGEDYLKLDSDETKSKTTADATEPITHNKDTQLVSELNAEDSPACSMLMDERPSDVLSINDDAAIEFPPTQVMERADDCDSPDPDRIPPHVFARTKSTAPVEWSVASNESLFSIHMGNMSFTRDHVSWFTKSGELGLIGEGQFSGPLVDVSNVPSPAPSTELGIKSGNLNQGLGATEAAAAETMREVIRENAADNGQEKLSPPTQHHLRPYKRSDDSSIKSFAFPILTGEVDKSGSINAGNEKKKKQQSLQPPFPEATEQTEQTEPQTPKQQTPKATKNTAQTRWFSCFSCCPLCS